jgi:8-oxo-dGTP diphosphatase
MTYKLVSRAIIYDHEGKLLLARRTSKSGHGQWALVGGKPERDEAPAETVVREVKEETALVFTPCLL